jgi:hypothetical protein
LEGLLPVVVVGVVVGATLPLVVFGGELLPHPATAMLAASAARIVSMPVSGVLFTGGAPDVATGLGRSPYQASSAPIAVASCAVRRSPNGDPDGR